MSYNGSGTFQINSTGQPVVSATTISSTVFNALTADLGTGLSTAITKDGQTTTTASVPFAVGIAVTTGITTPSTTFALVNTTATTVNFAGGATAAINVGAAGNTTTWTTSSFVITGDLQVTGGNVGVGVASDSSRCVLAQYGSLGGTDQRGFSAVITANSSATADLIGYSTTLATAASAFTCALIYGFHTTDATKGATSSITTQAGYNCNDLTTGTNNYAFLGQVTSGANKSNLRMSGTAKNEFAGPLYLAQDDSTLQSSCALWAGTGVPNNANGTDGDFYFRSNGVATAFIYHRAAGAWTAFA